jgi:hypothetical protein
MRIAVSCLACALVGGQFTPAVSDHVDRFLQATDTPLVSYRAVRQLEAAARNGQMRATLTAITSLDPQTGFQFEVVNENGSSVIRNKVLRAALEAIEGRLVKRPSFWTRRVHVVRQYARMAGVRVPVSMESTADVLIVGRSTFSMRYEYQTINAVPSRP